MSTVLLCYTASAVHEVTAKKLFDIDSMQQNRRIRNGYSAETNTGNLRYIVRLLAPISDEDIAGSAPIGAQSFTDWFGGRDYCNLP